MTFRSGLQITSEKSARAKKSMPSLMASSVEENIDFFRGFDGAQVREAAQYAQAEAFIREKAKINLFQCPAKDSSTLIVRIFCDDADIYHTVQNSH
jgi:hypothetical protein